MSKRTRTPPPPICYICKKNCKAIVDRIHYCICDIAICDKCINSVKINEETWLCPKCKNKNDLKESLLFRIK